MLKAANVVGISIAEHRVLVAVQKTVSILVYRFAALIGSRHWQIAPTKNLQYRQCDRSLRNARLCRVLRIVKCPLKRAFTRTAAACGIFPNVNFFFKKKKRYAAISVLQARAPICNSTSTTSTFLRLPPLRIVLQTSNEISSVRRLYHLGRRKPWALPCVCYLKLFFLRTSRVRRLCRKQNSQIS